MFLMFWAGSYWRDPAPQDSASAPRSVPSRETAVPPARCMVATVVVLAIAAAWPVYAAYLDRSGGAAARPALRAPAGAAGWSLTAESLTDWRPLYDGAAATLVQVYRKGDQVVAVHLGFYRHQRKGAELLTSTNIMIVQKHPVWANIGESRRTEDLGRGPMEVRQTLLRSAGQRLVVWDWYRVSGRDLVSPAVGKLLLARDRLLGRGDDAAAIILFTPQREQPGAAEETLRQFARDMLPSIDDALARVPPAGTP
jgi:EpsI family protein